MFLTDVGIKGLPPGRLMHRNPLPGEPDPTVKKRTGMTKEEQDYLAEFEKSKYKMEDGTLYLPGEAIHKMLTNAAVNFQIPGKGKTTYKRLVIGSLMVEPAMIVDKIQTAIPHRAWVRIKQARIVRTRALLAEWELDFVLRVTSDQFPEDALKQILEHASQCEGLGDHRPTFGRFIVTKFERQEAEEKD